MKPHITLTKPLGKTPLECIEAYKEEHPQMHSVPMAYAGRLDPMAEGKLLVLVGEECKKQEQYHALDKEYVFEILFDIASDTADVLGITSSCGQTAMHKHQLALILDDLKGSITLPYPHFSSKTVHGKPLHTWKLEGMIDQIEIPTKSSTIHSLSLINVRTTDLATILQEVKSKIGQVTVVTEERKALGNDFRRADVLAAWETLYGAIGNERTYTIAKVRCIASSGTYMRTLAEVIAQRAGTCGLAYSIKRTTIGTYRALPFGLGFWSKRY